MKNLTNIEVLRLKRQALFIEMNNCLNDIRLREQFKITCKELRNIDEQIKLSK